MDGSRTGTASPSKENVAETVGTLKGGKYIAPNGKTYRKRSTVGKTARIVLDAQRSADSAGYGIGCAWEKCGADGTGHAVGAFSGRSLSDCHGQHG